VNDYSRLYYCGGHPGLKVCEPTEATVNVSRKGITIGVKDGQVCIPWPAVREIKEEQHGVGRQSQPGVTITASQVEGVSEAEFEIALVCPNGYYARALAMRLGLAVPTPR